MSKPLSDNASMVLRMVSAAIECDVFSPEDLRDLINGLRREQDFRLRERWAVYRASKQHTGGGE